MFGRKKKEEISDQQSYYRRREAPRYDLKAGITINGYFGEGQLGNISILGCSMKSITYVDIVPDKIYQADIIPGIDDKLEPFSLNLKLNWTKSSETLFQAGFSLDDGSVNTMLRQYVEILRSRGVPPDYGNMDPKQFKDL